MVLHIHAQQDVLALGCFDRRHASLPQRFSTTCYNMEVGYRDYNDYQYEDDFQPERQIRLLKILHVSAKDDDSHSIDCKVTAWYLEQELDLPKFNAISYTWGDATNLAPISLKHGASHQVLMITQNCEAALKQAWGYDRNAWYWVDSICINQRNPREKEYQIPLMGHIYGKAEHVLACIGQHADGSQELYHFIDLLSRDESISLAQQPRIRESIVSNVWDKSSQSYETIVSVFTWLIALLSRSYFTRVWVFQELHLAKRVSFACGPDFFSSKELCGLSRCNPPWEDYWSLDEKYRSVPVPRDYWLRSLPPTRELLEAAASSGTELMSFKHVLDCVYDAALQCRDTVDKVLGILAVVDWKDKEPIVPDYRETDKFSLAVMVLNKISELEGNDLSKEDVLKMAYVLQRLFGLSLVEARRLAYTKKYILGGVWTVDGDIIQWKGPPNFSSALFTPRSRSNSVDSADSIELPR